jgi:shikimate dehydrogenase
MSNFAAKISGKAKIAGVIGSPVSHSLSPKLMNYWLAHYFVDGAYIPIPVKPEDLEHVIRALPKMQFRGVNVTIPYKQAVMPFLDIIDDEARAIGAVNTITIDQDGKLRGTNTDAYGFGKNIMAHMPARLHKAVVLGAGGAAKAVCHSLLKEGFKEVMVINRSKEKAVKLAEEMPGLTVDMWERRDIQIGNVDLLVNATSLGMAGNDELEIDLDALPPQAVVTDLVYTPLMTFLLKKAKSQGNPIVDGLGMLIHQAVPGFKLWYGMSPEVGPEIKKHLSE